MFTDISLSAGGKWHKDENNGRQWVEPDYATMLGSAFRILAQSSPERLNSLINTMGTGLAEVLVHAMALINLQRADEAVSILHAHKHSSIANFLAEQGRLQNHKLEDVDVSSFKLLEPKIEALQDLARVFSVLVNEQLCDESHRNLSYRVLLQEIMEKVHKEGDVWSAENYRILEEARAVCGQVVTDEFDPPSTGLTSKSISELPHCPSDYANCPPSSLRSSSPCTSCSLEISASNPTDVLNISRGTLHVEKPFMPQPPQVQYQPHLNNAEVPQCSERTGSFQIVTSRTTDPVTLKDERCSSATHSIDKFETLVEGGASESHLGKRFSPADASAPGWPVKDLRAAEEEVEEVFYSFVILHASEDTDEAERLRARFESFGIGEGATFSQDFAVPGKSTLRCIEDAINNSAFTLLLLTQNFSTRLHEIVTNSALMNSIDHNHKFNTVIPLFPQENPLDKRDVPKVLSILVPLDEKYKSFEKNARKAIVPRNIDRQRQIWLQEQHHKQLREQQRRLQEDNRRQRELIREAELLTPLKVEQVELYMRQMLLQNSNLQAGPWGAKAYGPAPPQMHIHPPPVGPYPPSSIIIQNASYVMVGDGSTMTVDNSGDEDQGTAPQS